MSADADAAPALQYEGCSHFRFRLVCATLAGRRVRINNIRADADSGVAGSTGPGITEFEASFLRLLDGVTNGSQITINDTGTRVTFAPGVVTGGRHLDLHGGHTCPTARSVAWFAEALMWLAPFGKEPMRATLQGVTNDDADTCVDVLRTVTLPLMRRFGVGGTTDAGGGLQGQLELKVTARGCPPDGGGRIELRCPPVRSELESLRLVDEGRIRRVRGIAYGARVAPSTIQSVVEGAKSTLVKFQPDTYIHADHYRGKDAGKSPGFGVALVAESTTGCALSAEAAAPVTGGVAPTDIGELGAERLLSEIENGGCVDTAHQAMCLLFMALGPREALSQVRLGKLTPYTMEALRIIRDCFGVVFKLDADEETGTVLCSCRGIGLKNIAKKAH
jgi:RNA 3'-terminal phosphate cyclase-like protein